MQRFIPFLGLLFMPLLTSFYTPAEVDPEAILGNWRRVNDGLVIKISGDPFSESGATSEVDAWGNWEFDCLVEDTQFYKRIRWQEQSRYWTCDFMVFEMYDCSSYFNTRGQVRVLDNGQLEIVCPGNPTRYFNRVSPRLER